MSTLDKKKSNNNHKNINEHSKNEKNENDDVQMMQCTFMCVKCLMYSNTFVSKYIDEHSYIEMKNNYLCINCNQFNLQKQEMFLYLNNHLSEIFDEFNSLNRKNKYCMTKIFDQQNHIQLLNQEQKLQILDQQNKIKLLNEKQELHILNFNTLINESKFDKKNLLENIMKIDFLLKKCIDNNKKFKEIYEENNNKWIKDQNEKMNELMNVIQLQINQFEKNKIIKINVNKLEKKTNYLITIFNQSVKDFKNEINIINNDLKKFKSIYINDKTVKKIESLLLSNEENIKLKINLDQFNQKVYLIHIILGINILFLLFQFFII